eukprot:NODE_453_length_1654_cov_316.932087_g348_i0.p1 GENE.NODE_453_length_1654_cov_316.932087_g348_i0~~NODE_453_length_1654_cov_316.932087_g348_i0.p1  ORF type:complete len:515 (+),score=145.41 NODE_453_length_1654_cov_316.932087_g348_i0:65-1546(+)
MTTAHGPDDRSRPAFGRKWGTGPPPEVVASQRAKQRERYESEIGPPVHGMAWDIDETRNTFVCHVTKCVLSNARQASATVRGDEYRVALPRSGLKEDPEVIERIRKLGKQEREEMGTGPPTKHPGDNPNKVWNLIRMNTMNLRKHGKKLATACLMNTPNWTNELVKSEEILAEVLTAIARMDPSWTEIQYLNQLCANVQALTELVRAEGDYSASCGAVLETIKAIDWHWKQLEVVEPLPPSTPKKPKDPPPPLPQYALGTKPPEGCKGKIAGKGGSVMGAPLPTGKKVDPKKDLKDRNRAVMYCLQLKKKAKRACQMALANEPHWMEAIQALEEHILFLESLPAVAPSEEQTVVDQFMVIGKQSIQAVMANDPSWPSQLQGLHAYAETIDNLPSASPINLGGESIGTAAVFHNVQTPIKPLPDVNAPLTPRPAIIARRVTNSNRITRRPVGMFQMGQIPKGELPNSGATMRGIKFRPGGTFPSPMSMNKRPRY